MGWYHDLEVRCTVHPDFLDFYRNKYIMTIEQLNQDYEAHDKDCKIECEDTNCKYLEDPVIRDLPKSYKDLIRCWVDLDIGHHFQEFDLSGAIGTTLSLHLSKKVTRHEGDLWSDYETFLHDVIVPTTTEITYCKISEDDYGNRTQLYTDLELRGCKLNLQQLIRSVHHVWQDGVIAETRVVYKRGIPGNQQLDLERLYERGY
jgi:hypothetical protein